VNRPPSSLKNGPGRQPLADLNTNFGPAPGFHSKHQRYISKDRQLLKTLETAVKAGEKSGEKIRPLTCEEKNGANSSKPPFFFGHEPYTELDAIHLLRRHFSLRASEVLVPLNRYFTSLIATPSSTATTPRSSVTVLSSSSSATRTLRPFVQADFMASLKTYGSPLPFRSRSKQKEFYEHWLRTPAFGRWLAERDAETRLALQDKGRQPGRTIA
jgi:hypothetical protein